MKHIKPYTLYELNKVDKYYQANPDKLDREDEIENPFADYQHELEPQAVERIKKRIAELKKEFTEHFQQKWNLYAANSLGEVYDGLTTYKLDGQTRSFFIVYIRHLLVAKVAMRNKMQAYYGKTEDVAVLGGNEMYDYFQEHAKAVDFLTLKNHQEKTFAKFCIQHHVHPDTARPAMRALKNFRWQAEQQIAPVYFDILRKLTVTPSKLPKTLWRGMVVDMFDMKDTTAATKEDALIEFKTKWAKGAKPGTSASRGRVTSWTTSKVVAAAFMSRGDTPNVIHVLCRYDNPTIEDIICDTRSLPNSEYWGEQEIMLDPEAVDFTVVESFFAGENGGMSEEDENAHKQFIKSFGKKTPGYMLEFPYSRFRQQAFDYHKSDWSEADRMQFKSDLNKEWSSSFDFPLKPGMSQMLQQLRRIGITELERVSANEVSLKFASRSHMYTDRAVEGYVPCNVTQRIATVNHFVFDIVIHLDHESKDAYVQYLLRDSENRDAYTTLILKCVSAYPHVKLNVRYDII